MVPLSFLPYDIAACTSYSEEGHPNQLAAAAARGETDITANNKAVAAGWLSQRFCTYPQVVVLRLKPGTCRIRKLEVLVHHFMISTKLEFYIGKNRTGDDWDFRKASAGQAGLGVDLHTNESSVTFEHLGFVSLNDGVEVAFKARELKSIHIDAEGDYLKIVVHKCWVNNLNLYNQIGLVAVSMFGERCRTLYESDFENFQQQSLLGLDQLSEIVPDVPHDNANAALWGLINESATERRMPVGQSLAFGVGIDNALADLVAAVIMAKDQAVEGKDAYSQNSSLVHYI
ncbi:hypothetical protein HKX48_004095 [Thoreauomyces humboldtii]|nr:hypothetical protein HKX48_004095 [Thoreauomyces humboldtii]